MFLTIKNIFWCNAYLGTTKNKWDNNMSYFICGYKNDVYFINILYTKLIISKILRIFRNIVKYRKIIFMLVPSLILKQAKFLKKNKKKKKKYHFFKNIKNLSVLTLNYWFFGILTNFKRVNKERCKLPVNQIPSAIVMLTDKVVADGDYVNIIREGVKVDTLVMGLVDTDQDPLIYDYPIPGSSKSFEFSGFLYRSFIVYLFLQNLKIKSSFCEKFLYNSNI